MVVIARLLIGLELPGLELPVLLLPVLLQPARSAVAPMTRPHPSLPMV
jgi:hypothetical protein